MIRLGLRLTFGSDREALLRVLITAAAVALGGGLLLFTLAGVNGLQAQTNRGAWLNTSAQTPPSTSASSPAAPLLWLLSIDQFGDQEVDRVDVAATGPGSLVPPGIARLPGPGEFYASPGLMSLLKSVPMDQLGDRFPGHEIGTIGTAALPSPNSLIIVIGHDARQLSQVPGVVEVRGIQRTPSGCFSCQSGTGSGPVLRWMLAGVAVALLLPVLILIATASRLSAARREQRFAAMRLVGATPHQISVIAAVEATVAAVAGVTVGFVLFFLFRPLLYHVSFTGAPFTQGDLSLSWIDVALVVIGVPITAAISARVSLRRVRVSPLGVTRRASSAPPGSVRIVPLLAGIALLAYFDTVGKPKSTSGQIQELLLGVVLIVVGLVLAGPWLTKVGSRLMANRARRPASLIAARRLLDNPRAAFRSISGLVVALFVTSAAVAALGSLVATRTAGGSARSTDTLVDQFCGTTTACDAGTAVSSVAPLELTRFRSTPGVSGVTVVHVYPLPGQPQSEFTGIVACAALAHTPAIGKCAPGATAAAVGDILQSSSANTSVSSTVWPSVRVPIADIASLPIEAVVVATNGSFSSLEQVRTSLEAAFPLRGIPVGVEAITPKILRFLTMVQDMTEVVVVASLIIAACSLAVNIASGLSERRRPFSLLRLTGVPTGVLRRVITLESALPLLLVAIVSLTVGLAAAALFLRSQLSITLRVPGFAYWATVLGGLVASLAIIASTFPLLNRITGPEVARNE